MTLRAAGRPIQLAAPQGAWRLTCAQVKSLPFYITACTAPLFIVSLHQSSAHTRLFGPRPPSPSLVALSRQPPTTLADLPCRASRWGLAVPSSCGRISLPSQYRSPLFIRGLRVIAEVDNGEITRLPLAANPYSLRQTASGLPR